ncbi:Protein of unknown function DUF953, thioredoxin-like [Carpediemonas membranifera]|uniref:Thioredoxin domain-containing protein n=1 Tax=Carpediemonas membranifera TaxID=201153 RepID=A0A8J6B0S2_9EUKA|nr:Protein of unknown function DUF953, thioredoxin-like [Carpediemonas membranifera]|eukprot:KAG9396845.1 Protein of unknown function DUF953, thioredoxin-like [Carpediemonas membranifera]
MKTIQAEPERIEREVRDVEAAGETALLWFYASEREETGRSWCPDCSAAEPVIAAAMETCRHESYMMIKCAVGLPLAWKDEDHPCRHMTFFDLKRLPTLLRLDHGKVVASVIEGDCSNTALVTEFFQ